jgi:hypothetical protein
MSDRKYRQRGYQDEERSEKPAKRGPREQKEGPRGRGLGAPTRTVFRCAVCGAEVQAAGGTVALDATCSGCGAHLHTCTHCAHFDSSARFECRQPIPERVAGKARRNACAFFEPKQAREISSEKAEPSDPRAAFDALFKL